MSKDNGDWRFMRSVVSICATTCAFLLFDFFFSSRCECLDINRGSQELINIPAFSFRLESSFGFFFFTFF